MAKSKRAAEILKKFEQAKRQRQKKDMKWRELDAFDRGEQWDLGGVQVPEWVPRPVTNYVHLVKTTKRASLAIENPSAMILGQSAEDHQLAKKLQKVVDFVWKQMKARSTVRDALETSKLLGTGIVQVYFDYENGTVKGGKGGKYQGEIKMRQIDPGNFYPDPNAFRIEDAEYVFTKYRRPLAWVRKKFNNDKITASSDAENERGEIYNRDYSTEAKDDIVDYIEYYEKVANDPETGGYTYYVTILAGETVVQERKECKPNCYPFAILYDYKQRQDFWAKSTCEVILDNQKLLNKVESIVALIGTLLQNPQKIISDRSGIDPEEAAIHSSTPGYVWVVNGNVSEAMVWQNPPQIPMPLFNLAEQARQNIREITGLTEAYMGQTVGSMQTSSGVNSLIERSTMRDRDQMYDLELFIEDLVHIMIKFITEFYTETRIARITGGKGQEPEFLAFNGSDYKELSYDITVDVSAKAPITKARKQEELDKVLNIQGQYQYEPALITPQEYMRESDYIDGEILIERMNMEEIQSAEAIISETMQMVMEAQQQGVGPQEAAEMAQAMLQTRFQEKQQGTGSTSQHSGEMQMRQGTPQGI